MKKLTSILLALAMTSSLAPTNIMAARRTSDGYSSIKLPVVNEVRDVNADDSESYEMYTVSGRYAAGRTVGENDTQTEEPTPDVSGGVAFEHDYYYPASDRQYVKLTLNEAASKKLIEELPENYDEDNCTLCCDTIDG